MKGYVRPEVLEISDMMETVGLASGGINEDGYAIVLNWSGHDTGSMSEAHGQIFLPRGVTSKIVYLTLVGGRTLVKFKGAYDSRVKYEYIGQEGGANGIKITLTIPEQEANNNTNSVPISMNHMVFAPGPVNELAPDIGFQKADGGDRVNDGSYCYPSEGMDPRYNGYQRSGVPMEIKGASAIEGPNQAFMPSFL